MNRILIVTDHRKEVKGSILSYDNNNHFFMRNREIIFQIISSFRGNEIIQLLYPNECKYSSNPVLNSSINTE